MEEVVVTASTSNLSLQYSINNTDTQMNDKNTESCPLIESPGESQLLKSTIVRNVGIQ